MYFRSFISEMILLFYLFIYFVYLFATKPYKQNLEKNNWNKNYVIFPRTPKS